MSDAWVGHVPHVFRALADPALQVAVPRPTDGSLEDACATWGALHYVPRSVLGWTDVGVGLAWWYTADKPVDDSPVLALVREVWGRDGLLDYYAAWAWRPERAGWLHSKSQDAFNGPSPTWLAKHSVWADKDWWRRFIRRGQVGRHDPFYGGTDPLHLTAHEGPPCSNPSPDPLAQVFPDRRRVFLVTGDLDYWLADLQQLGAQLPPLGERSWRVEVFDRTVGWLGEFRRSRVTGHWFTGRHSIHLRGNKPHE